MFLEVSNIFGVVNKVYRLVQVTVKLSHTKLFRAHYMITGQFGSKEARPRETWSLISRLFSPYIKLTNKNSKTKY
jgi:hypothetical protein